MKVRLALSDFDNAHNYNQDEMYTFFGTKELLNEIIGQQINWDKPQIVDIDNYPFLKSLIKQHWLNAGYDSEIIKVL